MRGKNLNFYTSTVDVDLQHTRRTQEVWEMDSAVSEYLAEDLADSPDQSANGIISTILTGTLLCLVLALLVLVRLFLVRNIFDMEAAIRYIVSKYLNSV